ncbi:hypothetical protein C8J56DRAFT_365886 [Mycena floridula]|nr:hypothetical protein C8J56DRAFT_365886 [Mycena floridula]
MEASGDSDQGSPSPFSIWVSQAQHIIHAQGINSSRVQTVIPYTTIMRLHCSHRKSANQSNRTHPLMEHDMIHLFIDCGLRPCSWCWSADPSGQKAIPHQDVEDAFGLQIDISTLMWHLNVPPQLYSILQQIHEACGFNPDSMEMAEYLGYPLLEPVLETNYIFEEGTSESDNDMSASKLLTRENSEIGSDSESENGSTSSDDTFLSADSKIQVESMYMHC